MKKAKLPYIEHAWVLITRKTDFQPCYTKGDLLSYPAHFGIKSDWLLKVHECGWTHTYPNFLVMSVLGPDDGRHYSYDLTELMEAFGDPDKDDISVTKDNPLPLVKTLSSPE